MRFKLETLVDMSETGEHRGVDQKKCSQQANYNTVIQTLGLRSNIVPVSLKKRLVDLKYTELGNAYSGTHLAWVFVFDVESGGNSIVFMNRDFSLVPIITGLDETVILNTNMFVTQNAKWRNIVFNEVNDD